MKNCEMKMIDFLSNLLQENCIDKSAIEKVVDKIVMLAQNELIEKYDLVEIESEVFLPKSTIKILKDLYFYTDRSKIKVIKSLRELTGLGLLECKDIANKLIDKW